jgi:hypothetical protein
MAHGPRALSALSGSRRARKSEPIGLRAPAAGYRHETATRVEETSMASERSGGSVGGIGLGGILVIVGVVLMIVWSFWIGLIVALIGLIAFGGFARGKWY